LRQSSAQQVDHELSWKQEVNRRVAEHKGRRGGVKDENGRVEAQPPAGTRAAEAVARVAARYAKAPSYSEMLADEARAAVRAAEANSRAALQAQAAAEHLLAGIEAASFRAEAQAAETGIRSIHETALFEAAAPEIVSDRFTTQIVEAPGKSISETTQAVPSVRSNVVEPVIERVIEAQPEKASFQIRWDADMPLRQSRNTLDKASLAEAIFEALPANPGWTTRPEVREPLHSEGFEVDAAQPIHANLIEFPRELVATRKVRPRRAEGGFAAGADDQPQLSIFEVDPGRVCTEPATTAPAHSDVADSMGPKWSGITFDEQPQEEMALPRQAVVEREYKLAESGIKVQAAPMNLRMMAALVDCSFVAAAFLGTAAMEWSHMKVMPAVKILEAESALGLIAIGVAYLAFFLVVLKATPGMKYARLTLSGLDGRTPPMKQRFIRAGATILSLLPVGLGAALAVFDEQSLCWHDRLSATYPRKS
jgi:hypothetical protein